MTAIYSGSEAVSYQWKNGETNVGGNSNKFTPTTAGSYTVTVSAPKYNSKTSTAVNVTALATGYEVMYYAVLSQYDLPDIKAGDQEVFDEFVYNTYDIKFDAINKTVSKSLAFKGNGVAVIIVPASLGNLIIKDAGDVVITQTFDKFSITFNGIGYYLYDGKVSGSVNYSLTVEY